MTVNPAAPKQPVAAEARRVYNKKIEENTHTRLFKELKSLLKIYTLSLHQI